MVVCQQLLAHCIWSPLLCGALQPQNHDVKHGVGTLASVQYCVGTSIKDDG